MYLSPELKQKMKDFQNNISPELKQKMKDLQNNLSPELKTQMAQFQQQMSPDMLEKMSLEKVSQPDTTVEMSKPNELKQRKINSKQEIEEYDNPEISIAMLKILYMTSVLYKYRNYLKYGFILLMGTISIYALTLYNYV